MEFVRGDTQPFRFKIIDKDGSLIPIEELDTLILSCRKYNMETCECVISKNKTDFKVSDGYYHCKFEPKDTENLPYGIYNFDIEATLKNGYRKTLKSSFRITEEDTIHGDEDGI